MLFFGVSLILYMEVKASVTAQGICDSSLMLGTGAGGLDVGGVGSLRVMYRADEQPETTGMQKLQQ